MSGCCRTPAKNPVALLPVLLAIGILSGCAGPQPIATQALIQHQALIDFSGLAEARAVDSLKVQWAVPESWQALPEDRNPIYIHQQYKSPTGATGVGVAYIRVPLPLRARTIVRMAKNEYHKRERDGQGRVIDEWIDEFGRHWIEGENEKYYVRAYVVARGFDAWIIYLGRKITEPPNAAELSLAVRSQDSIIPLPLLGRGRAAMDSESLEVSDDALAFDLEKLLLLHKVHNPAQAVAE